MDKQRLAEIMYEISESGDDLESMDVSVLLLVYDNSKVTQIGVSTLRARLAMVAMMCKRTAEQMGEDIIPFMMSTATMICAGEEDGADEKN